MATGIELPTRTADINSPSAYGPEDSRRDSGPKEKKRQDVAAFLRQSRKRWETADAASFKLRRAMREDQLFESGGGYQWDTADQQARSDQGRPCIEINRIPQFIRQVSNANRANRSSIIVHARAAGATRQTAQALQALVRSVEVDSDADVVYDTATQNQLINGLGVARMVNQWGQDEEFQQHIRLKRVRNPLSVYWDPSTQEADWADIRWAHIIGVMLKEEYEERWGDIAPYQSLNEFMSGQNNRDDWAPDGKVVLAEYYYLQIVDETLLRMSTGQNIWERELEKFQMLYALAHPGEPPAEVVRERVVPRKVPFWCLHNAIAILEGNKELTAGRQCPGDRIPIFPLIGDERDIDGVVDYRGMTRDAKDPQKMYNFWSSSIAEAVALAPKAPWIAAKGQVEQFMDDWKNANREAKSVLLYNPKAVGDILVPPPQRNTAEPAIQAMVMGLREADQDLKSVMGLFDPSLGQGRQSESGKARELLQNQGMLANSNYADNLQRMKRSIGRTMLQWFPVVYDVPRVMHLVDPGGKRKEAVIYAGAQNQPAPEEFPDITNIVDVGVGQFDVSVSTGPSYQNEREATRAWLLELFKVMPQLAQVGADILLENSDSEAAVQLAARAKKLLPPQFQDEGDPEAQLAKLQAENQQKDMLLELANSAIGTMAKVIDGKEIENETKKQVAMMNNYTKMAIEAAKLQSGQQTQALQSQDKAADRAEKGKDRDQALTLAKGASQDNRDLKAFDAEVQRFGQQVDHIHETTLVDMNAQNQALDTARQQSGALQQMEKQAELTPPESNGGGKPA